jgi:hypothetical protein
LVVLAAIDRNTRSMAPALASWFTPPLIQRLHGRCDCCDGAAAVEDL